MQYAVTVSTKRPKNSSKVAGKGKHRGLRVLWLPTKSHKKSKNKYYVSHRDADSDSPTRSIMSGDSPNAFTNEHAFDFREGRHSPAPTTSKEAIQASIQVEPPKEVKEKDDSDKKENENPGEHFNTPILNPGDEGTSHGEHSDEPDTNFDDSKAGGGGDLKELKNLLNGNPGKPADGANNLKNFEEPEEDSCIVNCLYYTMECCKCSIM